MRVRVKKTRQNKEIEPPFRFNRNGKGSSPAIASDQGFVFDDDANEFFTAAENFSQLHVSEPSSQRVDFDRSTGRFATKAGGFLGVNTIGGPTG
jgi:hypothetical protein